MTVSLSESLNFKVNNYPIILGRSLDAPNLNAHEIDRSGFFARLLLRPEKGELLYLSKNSTLTGFAGSDFSITPVRDQKNQKKVLFGTIAYLWYKHNRLSKFGFQIVQHAAFKAAPLFEELEKRIAQSVTPPTDSSKTHKVWDRTDQKLVLSLPLNNQYGYIHLMLKE